MAFFKKPWLGRPGFFVVDRLEYFLYNDEFIPRRKSMSNGAAAVAAEINALKAMGSIVSVGPDEFTKIVRKADKPLVVSATGGLLKTNYRYLTSYKGLFFYTKSAVPLEFSGNTELVAARKIWIPR